MDATTPPPPGPGAHPPTLQPNPRGWPELWPWFAVEFANSCACTLFTVGVYDFLHSRLHASPSSALWLSASWGFAYIFIALAAGRRTERHGPRFNTLAMSALSVLTTLIGLAVLAFPNLITIFFIMFLYNCTSTPIWPAVESGLTQTRAPMPLLTRMGIFNLSWGSAGFVALFLRGALEAASWAWIFILPAALHLVGFLILWRFGVPASAIAQEHVQDSPSEKPHFEQAPTHIHTNTPNVGACPQIPHIHLTRAQQLLYMAWLGNALAYVAINVLIPLLDKIAAAAGMHELVAGGMLTSAWSFSRFIGFGLLWLWTGWHYRTRWLIATQILLAATFLAMLTWHSQIAFIAMQFLFGLAIAMMYSSALYYAMHVSAGHGGHAGIHEALIGLGVAVGPTIGALSGAADSANPVQALNRIAIGVTLLLALGIIAMAILARRARYNPPPINPPTPESP